MTERKTDRQKEAGRDVKKRQADRKTGMTRQTAGQAGRQADRRSHRQTGQMQVFPLVAAVTRRLLTLRDLCKLDLNERFRAQTQSRTIESEQLANQSTSRRACSV